MKHGEKLRLRNHDGGEFAITVGVAFEPATIQKFLDSGEWSLADTNTVAEPAGEEPAGDSAEEPTATDEIPAEPTPRKRGKQ